MHLRGRGWLSGAHMIAFCLRACAYRVSVRRLVAPGHAASRPAPRGIAAWVGAAVADGAVVSHRQAEGAEGVEVDRLTKAENGEGDKGASPPSAVRPAQPAVVKMTEVSVSGVVRGRIASFASRLRNAMHRCVLLDAHSLRTTR